MLPDVFHYFHLIYGTRSIGKQDDWYQNYLSVKTRNTFQTTFECKPYRLTLNSFQISLCIIFHSSGKFGEILSYEVKCNNRLKSTHITIRSSISHRSLYFFTHRLKSRCKPTSHIWNIEFDNNERFDLLFSWINTRICHC